MARKKLFQVRSDEIDGFISGSNVTSEFEEMLREKKKYKLSDSAEMTQIKEGLYKIEDEEKGRTFEIEEKGDLVKVYISKGYKGKKRNKKTILSSTTAKEKEYMREVDEELKSIDYPKPLRQAKKIQELKLFRNEMKDCYDIGTDSHLANLRRKKVDEVRDRLPKKAKPRKPRSKKK